MSAARADTGALGALLLGGVLIGLAPIFVRVADVGPVACAFWRCALAWPLLYFALWREKTLPAPGKTLPLTHVGLLVGAGLFFAADLALWHAAIGRTSVANATLLANLAPLFVAPAAWLLWHERATRGFVLGLFIALAGTAILVDPSASLSRPPSLVGDGLAVAAAAFYAGYLLSVARLRRSQSTLKVMTWSSGTVALVLLPVALLLDETVWPQSARGWAMLAGLALLSHAAGQGLIAHALATLPASLSAAGLLVQPLAAALFAWSLLGEPFGAQQALGGAIILAGIMCCRWSATTSPAAARS